MTLYFNSHSIIIRRQRHKSGLRYGFSATGTVQSMDLQPMEIERVNQAGGQIGKMYDAFLDASVDIKEGDQVKVTDTGKTFAVKSVSTFENAGLLDHHQLILISQD